MFRHEKTFYNKPGVFVKVTDDLDEGQIKAALAPAEAYLVNYVGIDLTLDGFAVESVSGSPQAFAKAVQAVRGVTKRPLILVASDPAVAAAGLSALLGRDGSAVRGRCLQLGGDGRPGESSTRRPWRCAAQPSTSWQT